MKRRTQSQFDVALDAYLDELLASEAGQEFSRDVEKIIEASIKNRTQKQERKS